MAVSIIKVNFLKEGLGGGQDDEGQVSQDQILRVEFSGVVGGVTEAIQLIAGFGFRKGSLHPFDSNLYLNGGIEAEVLQDDTGKTWDFDLSYSSKGSNPTDNSNSGNYRPEIVPGSWTYTEVVDRDKETGEPFLNPAGDPIDPLPIEVISAPTMVITIQEYGDFMERQQLVGSINSGPITIAGTTAPQYCVMLERYVPKPYWDEDGFLTFRNTFHLKFKFKESIFGFRIGFQLESVEQGFNQLVNEVREAIKIPDENGDLVLTSVPLMLDEIGAVTDTPFYVQRVAHDLIDFSQFGLPTAYPVI